MTSPRLTAFAHEFMGTEHAHLDATDQCYFIWEYTSGQRYDYSETNQLIKNLKIKPAELRQKPYRLRYKESAMATCAKVLADNLADTTGVVFVPIPPSKIKTDPDHDDRISNVLQKVNAIIPIDIRELVIQKENTRSSHEAGDDRLTQEELLDVWEIDESLAEPYPSTIIIVDDMLTAGTHFKAMQTLLRQRFLNSTIFGVFITRRVFANMDDIEDF